MKKTTTEADYTPCINNGTGITTTTTGYSYMTPIENTTTKIEIVIKALGTMVMMPQYESNPEIIGSKMFVGNIQMPIVSGEDRKKVEEKLLSLIDSL